RSSSKLHPGVLIVVQRFRSDLGLFVHLHALVTDGCFEAPAVTGDAAVFLPAIGLGEQDLLRALQRLHADLAEHLEDASDGKPVDEALVACVQLGLPLRAVGPSPSAPPPTSPMLVRGFGMQLHAAVTVDGRDRKRLERVCRYLLRPPFALDAVERTADGQVRVHFKKPNRFGATYAQMTPHAFVARLCALVPPPRAHTVLYYGVLSAHHALRCAVVPCANEPEPEPKQLSLFIPRGQLELPAITTLLHAQLRDAAPSRLPWMKLLARVFRIDISVCSRCSGPMRVTRAVTTPEDIAAELRGARPPPRAAVLGQLLLFSASPAAA
ncbi:MAG: transposase, partial [Sandaracinaceae bacterium]